MAEVKDQWCDEYPLVTWIDHKGKRDNELQVYATQVIDGKGYRIAMPPDGQDGLMKTYCIGPVKVVDGKAVILEKPKKQVTDTPPALIYHAQDFKEKAVTKSSPIDSTCQNIVTHEKDNIVTRGRPKTDLPIDEIMELHKQGIGSRNIVILLGLKVTYRTVARVIEGQGVLV